MIQQRKCIFSANSDNTCTFIRNQDIEKRVSGLDI